MWTDVEAEHERIIADAAVLCGETPVGPLIGRRGEAAALRSCLLPMQRGQAPLNAWLHGPPGSGKTMLARWVVQDTCTAASRVAVYVSCEQHRTLYSVAQAIVDELRILRAEAQDTNFKLDRIRQALRDRPAVVILDHIDRPMPAQQRLILQGLLSLPATGLVCIAGSANGLVRLDEQTRSRLSPMLIEFQPYSTEEIREIVIDRARRALMPGTWSMDCIDRIAAAAGGDARLAIQLLRQAAAAAEEAGRPALDPETVGALARCWAAIRGEARLAGLSEHERLIHRLASVHGPLGTSTLRHLYVRICEEQNAPPVACRTFSKYLGRLSSAGTIRMADRGGRGGRLICST